MSQNESIFVHHFVPYDDTDTEMSNLAAKVGINGRAHSLALTKHRDSAGRRITLNRHYNASIIGVLRTDPSEPPPYIYQFVKCRWYRLEEITENIESMRLFMEACPGVRVEFFPHSGDQCPYGRMILNERELVMAKMIL